MHGEIEPSEILILERRISKRGFIQQTTRGRAARVAPDRRANTRESIDATAEAVADILSGFDRMDVDEPSEKMKGARVPRNVSSELYGICRAPDVKLECSGGHVDAPSACTVEMPENAVSPASGASLDPEAKMEAKTACDSPGDDSMTSGPSAARLKNQARIADSPK
ncbi:hypothetical protein JB92DRAFT_3108270 [Gautieria morchelliformis]|nr:hypothetical protein JB92DRAFT_3108270 [Gautieria morchelliformis]